MANLKYFFSCLWAGLLDATNLTTGRRGYIVHHRELNAPLPRLKISRMSKLQKNKKTHISMR